MEVVSATTFTPSGTWLAAIQSTRAGTSAWQTWHQCASTTMAIGPSSGEMVIG
jgi:hypothetical protein